MRSLAFFMQIQNYRLALFIQPQRNSQLRQACRLLPGRTAESRLAQQTLNVNLPAGRPAFLSIAVQCQRTVAEAFRIAEIHVEFLAKLT